METANINLFVFDRVDNFERSKRFLGEEGIAYKRIICVEDAKKLASQLDNLDEDQLVFLAVHVFFTEDASGIRTFIASGILKLYPRISYAYFSSGDEQKIKHEMVDIGIEPCKIYKYHEIQTEIESGKIKPNMKKDLFKDIELSQSGESFSEYPQIDYAIITALYEDEFQELEKIFDFPTNEKIETGKKIYHIGYLKEDKTKKVVAAIPNATGMIDSSIIATQMVDFFKPKYLLMSGVCGGSDDYNIGDIIVAKQIYTFQKGKLSDIKRKDIDGKYVNIDIFDANGIIIDYNHLYDNHGNQISISIEKFEIEHDSIINLDTLIEDKLMPKKELIKTRINELISQNLFLEDKTIKIELEPIACSTMVINKNGFFEDTIKSINRKTAAIEMESYGVGRACLFANGGKTIPIIFKSVMDNTKNKKDHVNGFNVKKFAAYTSAQFMKYLFVENII